MSRTRTSRVQKSSISVASCLAVTRACSLSALCLVACANGDENKTTGVSKASTASSGAADAQQDAASAPARSMADAAVVSDGRAPTTPDAASGNADLVDAGRYDASVSKSDGGAKAAASNPDAHSASEVTADASAPPTDAADWPADCEQRHVFRAHGKTGTDDTTKLRIPGGMQFVAAFYFKAPWTDEQQLLKVHATIDNQRIVHHWVLSATHSKDVADGEVRIQPMLRVQGIGDEMPLSSGAVGATQVTLPDDVGMRMPGGADLMFELEVHYANSANQEDQEDATAVEICVTHTKRPIEAAFHLLGKQSFTLPAHAQTNVASTCAPEAQAKPIHLLAVTPHMHVTGTHSSLLLTRASGEQIKLLDKFYDVHEQRTYVLPEDGTMPDVVMNPGDTLTSTCTYDNQTDAAIQEGEAIQNEMCELNTLAWPAGALHNTYGALAGALPGNAGIADLICMDP